MVKLPFSEAFSQSIEILLPSNCHQFGSNKLIKILTVLGVSYVDIMECALPLRFHNCYSWSMMLVRVFVSEALHTSLLINGFPSLRLLLRTFSVSFSER